MIPCVIIDDGSGRHCAATSCTIDDAEYKRTASYHTEIDGLLRRVGVVAEKERECVVGGGSGFQPECERCAERPNRRYWPGHR